MEKYPADPGETAELALACLLHDIGKFLERANGPGTGLSPQSLGLEGIVCPVRKGRYSHRHVLYTNEFFLADHFWPAGLNSVRIANLACCHHRPDNGEQRLVTEADRLSSGMERLDRDPAEEAGRPGIRVTRMLPPLATVFPGEFDAARDGGRLDIGAFSGSACFPVQSDDGENLTASYAALWQEFVAAWDANRCPSPIGFADRASAVLEHFTWCVPSAVNARPDISLFDHLKTTAAIAVARRWAEDGKKPFLLLACGLDGIQRHIFDVHAGHGRLARRLRARSFHISAYADCLMLAILRRLRLPVTQCVMRAGGKFHLLLPNAGWVAAGIDALWKEASEWLYRESGAGLSLSRAWLAASDDELCAFDALADRLAARFRAERTREAAAILQDDSGWREEGFVLDGGVPHADRLCPDCGKMPEGSHPGGICEKCAADRELGKAITVAGRVAFHDDRSGDNAAPIGSFSLLSGEEGNGAAILACLGRFDPAAAPEIPLIAMPKARHVPCRGDGPIEFSDLGQLALGQKYLGYLKVDVDNLGYVFNQGFGGNASISRVAALSRSLEAFFSLHVEELLAGGEFASIYMLYSGGDDVAAIGPWNLVFDFALRLRGDLRRHAGSNPAWDLSAGLAVAPVNVPVTMAMAEAQQLLDASKTAPGRGGVALQALSEMAGQPFKGRISALSVSLPWSEFAKALAEAKQLGRWLGDGTVSASQIRRLLGYAEMSGNFQRTRDTKYFEYAPRLNRDLVRAWRGGTEEERKARDWAARLATPAGTAEMPAAGFVCRYALAANRG